MLNWQCTHPHPSVFLGWHNSWLAHVFAAKIHVISMSCLKKWNKDFTYLKFVHSLLSLKVDLAIPGDANLNLCGSFSNFGFSDNLGATWKPESTSWQHLKLQKALAWMMIPPLIADAYNTCEYSSMSACIYICVCICMTSYNCNKNYRVESSRK